MKRIFVVCGLFLTINCFGQKEALINYLNAYKTAEFEESQKIIQDYSFGVDALFTMSEYSSLEGLTFKTDFPKIVGYKAIVNCKIKNKGGAFIDKRMMVVLYYDKLKKHYAVFDMREVADIRQTYLTWKKEVEAGTFYTDKEYVYRNLSYWAMMYGQIRDAKKYIELAVTSAEENNNSSFSTQKNDLIIKRIM